MRILFSVFLTLVFCSNSQAEQGNETRQAPAQKTALQSPAPHKTGGQQAVSSKSVAPKSPPRETATRKATQNKAAERKQSVTFQSLEQMNQLIELGVPALALSLLEDEQKKRQPFTPDWYAFEYKRILLLAALEQWQQVIGRTQWLFDTAVPDRQITQKIRLWFESQQVMARLQLKQSELALNQLQHLLWSTSPEYRKPSLAAVWRQLVIRAYLQMQRDDDARKALVKYGHDYKTDQQDVNWLMLQAQVLLRTGRPQQAMKLLQQIETDEAKALFLIAKLQSDPQTADEINRQMRDQLDGQLLSRVARWAYSYVAYLASQVRNDVPSQILNLEAILSLGIDYPVFDERYQVTADDLWELYRQLGMTIANDNGLLFGHDDEWKKLSDQLVKKAPEQALALNAALVLHSDDFSTRQQQHQTIVEILELRKNGLELINQLYLHGSKFADVKVLPDEVRYRLVDYALAEGDYYEASTIMASLKQPPQGKTLFDWRMRKARVLILQGEYQQSENLIRRTFAEKKSITHAELDRYIQVVFDFQTVQQHQQAIQLFDLISLVSLDEKLKREIYFWKAESYFSLKKYDRAALFYLESARAVKGEEHDLWAQSARFKAAGALTLAEIYDDAEKVYSDLLLITASDSRKALINQNLQKIRLLKSASRKKPLATGK